MFLELWIFHADEVALVSQLQATMERDPVAGRVVAPALSADGRLALVAQPLMAGARDEPFAFAMGREVPRGVMDGEVMRVVYDPDGISVDATWTDDRVDLVVALDLADGVSAPRHLSTTVAVPIGRVGVALPGTDLVVLARPTEADPRELLVPAKALADELAALPKRARAQRIEELLDGP